jgi:putative transcriptional regulator
MQRQPEHRNRLEAGQIVVAMYPGVYNHYMSPRPCLHVRLFVVLLLALGGACLEAAHMMPVPSPVDMPRMPAPGMFLVATRYFQDPDFRETVVYLLQHDMHASFGVIVNQPSSKKLAEWLPDLAGTALASQTLYAGGPVNPELMVTLVENRAWVNTYDAWLLRHVQDGIFASMNPAIIDRLLPEVEQQNVRVRFYFGHIGWVPGQLEREIERDYWHLLSGHVDEVFSLEAGSLWERLIERLEPAVPLLSPEIHLEPDASGRHHHR